MKTRTTALLLVACASTVTAEVTREEYSPLLGVYDLVGRMPGSEETYSGVVTLCASGDELRVMRSVGGARTPGVARIEYVTPEKIATVIFEFSERGEVWETACMWGGDLDNYARLSCLRREKAVPTTEPGLEALFQRAGVSSESLRTTCGPPAP
jgi:hypothetical protein